MKTKIPKYLTFLLILLTLASCKGTNTLSNITTTSTIPGSSTNNSCNTQSIDLGLKGNVATTARGTFSDIRNVPGSDNYASVYYDSSALAIMISYWNGTSYSHEVIAGDTSAQYVRIRFLSDGKPLVFWTNNSTTLKMASRSAAFGATGSWSLGILDSFTGGANRALEVSVSPNDKVALIYLSTNTTATSRPRFVYCNSSCASASNYVAMSSTENIETTGAANFTIGQVSTGISWCGVDTDADLAVDTYYPAVAYSAAANQNRFAVCNQSNLVNCLTNTNWTKTNFEATTSNIASKLYIDPTIVNDTPKIVSLKTGSGLIAYQGNTGCSSVAAFTASNQTIGTSTSGSAWLEILKSSNGRFNIVANETTTSFRYYNTLGTNFISSVGNPTQWNGAGIFSTTTLLAAGATSGGATILPTSGTIISTYYQGAVSFNLLAGVVQDPTTSSATTTLSNSYINTRGSIQLNATPLKNISISATDDGYPGVAYVDFSTGASITGRLKYAYRNSLSKSASWNISLVPFVGSAPMFPSLRYDNQNRPWISYFDSNAANSKFYLMTNSSFDGSGQWFVYQFPINSITGAFTLPATNDTAITMYTSGGVSYPVMGVIDNNNTPRAVKVSKLNPSTGNWSTISSVYTLPAINNASWLSLDSDSNGNIIIGFQDLSAPIGVNYAYSSDGGLNFTIPKRIHASIGDGQGLSVKINPATSKPAATYYDRANNSVYYSTCSGTLANCATSGWSNTIVENAAATSTAYTTATTDQLLSTALSFNSEGVAHLFYPIAMGNVVGATNSGNLINVIIDSSLGQTKSTYLQGVNASAINTVNFGVTGHNVSSTETELGELLTAFIGSGNTLSVRSCGEE
jgi:hypothetical protein